MASQGRGTRRWSVLMMLCALAFVSATVVMSGNGLTDPGPRGGNAGAGGRIAGLTVKEAKFSDAGLEEFLEVQSPDGSVPDTEEGLGPRFNSNSCVSCHAHPAAGGTSPAVNPQVNLATLIPQMDTQVHHVTVTVPIISGDGPVREVRFATDGGVHDLFTIAGLPGAESCTLSQPNFAAAAAADGGFPGILRFRIPTPLFGLGLIEAIEDATILGNEAAPKQFGISGIANRNGNDGTVTRFGWKAQNKSLVIFAGEAYNVEQGITNELFPDERGEGGVPDALPPNCRIRAPQDSVNYESTQPQAVIDNTNAFANFMRFLAPPVPANSYGNVTSAQIAAGEAAFNNAGCNVCHKKSMTTGNHVTAALANKTVNLFSDLLLHDIGTGDGISQGGVDGTQSRFRTAPLWGVGQRLFFLHDGRSTDLLDAINQHGGEATRVINNFKGESTGADAQFNLDATARQNLVYFLRSL